MSDKSIDEELNIFFSKPAKADWNKIATREIQGKDPIDFLSWRGKDEILFLPYYDASDVADLRYKEGFNLPAAKNSHSGQRHWINLPVVFVSDEKNANSLALDHLSFGAEGVLFDVHSRTTFDLVQCMQNIEWPHCFVAFRIQPPSSFTSILEHFVQERFEAASLSGALFWESIPKKDSLKFFLEHCPNIRSLGLVIPPSTPAQEICEALLRGIEAIEVFADQDQTKIFRSLAFSLDAEPALLESVAKLKALRFLWQQIAISYGHSDYKKSDLHIHACVSPVKTEEFGPHENMLKGTFGSMAAILGGCDSLTLGGKEHTSRESRLQRNVSSILREESFFDRAADPLAGAFAVDAITESIAAKAWEMFQEKSRTT